MFLIYFGKLEIEVNFLKPTKSEIMGTFLIKSVKR